MWNSNPSRGLHPTLIIFIHKINNNTIYRFDCILIKQKFSQIFTEFFKTQRQRLHLFLNSKWSWKLHSTENKTCSYIVTFWSLMRAPNRWNGELLSVFEFKIFEKGWIINSLLNSLVCSTHDIFIPHVHFYSHFGLFKY